LLVVAAHGQGVELPDDGENPQGTWAATDQIAYEEQSVIFGKSDACEQVLELAKATVDVSNDDGSRHGA